MTTEIVTSRRSNREAGLPSYVHHPSFGLRSAAREFSPEILGDSNEYETKYMPDDVTREHARRMHYAAHKVHQSANAAQREEWFQTYFKLRDRIVMGNRKLIYRAVRRRMAMSHRADDLIGDCQIVLIQAVAAYNPWMGIRFSTYAYTCLVRALSRLSQRHAADFLSRTLPLDSLADGTPAEGGEAEPMSSGSSRLDVYFREDHPLLTHREKVILARRFRLNETAPSAVTQTLEKVGMELGLSKERVRQVQASALDKLRKALVDEGKPAG